MNPIKIHELKERIEITEEKLDYSTYEMKDILKNQVVIMIEQLKIFNLLKSVKIKEEFKNNENIINRETLIKQIRKKFYKDRGTCVATHDQDMDWIVNYLVDKLEDCAILRNMTAEQLLKEIKG